MAGGAVTKKSWIRTAIVMAVTLAVMAVLMRHEPDWIEILGSIVFMFALITGVSVHRPTRDFLAAHARLFFWLGLSIAIGGPLALIVVGLSFGIDPDQPMVTGILIGAMIVGALLLSLPRSLRRTAQLADNPVPKPKVPTRFNGWSQAWSALRCAPNNIWVFLRLALPWALILSIVPQVTLAVGLARYGSGFHFFLPAGTKVSDAVRLLWWQLPTLVVLALAVPSFAIAWHRFVIGDRRGAQRFVWPDRAVWSYLWRLAIMMSMLGTFIRMVVSGNAKDFAGVLGTSHVMVVAGLLYLATVILFVFGASSYALVFPAVAVGDKDRANLHAAFGAVPILGRTYAIGFVFALLPYFILRLAVSDLLYRVFGRADTPLTFAIGWGLELLFFAGAASGTAYLSRAYVVAISPSGAAADVTAPFGVR